MTITLIALVTNGGADNSEATCVRLAREGKRVAVAVAYSPPRTRVISRPRRSA